MYLVYTRSGRIDKLATKDHPDNHTLRVAAHRAMRQQAGNLDDKASELYQKAHQLGDQIERQLANGVSTAAVERSVARYERLWADAEYCDRESRVLYVSLGYPESPDNTALILEWMEYEEQVMTQQAQQTKTAAVVAESTKATQTETVLAKKEAGVGWFQRLFRIAGHREVVTGDPRTSAVSSDVQLAIPGM